MSTGQMSTGRFCFLVLNSAESQLECDVNTKTGLAYIVSGRSRARLVFSSPGALSARGPVDVS